MQQLIFLPGFLGAKEDWSAVQAFLSEYETVVFDLPHSDTLKTLTALCPQSSILIGYSMGGRVALQLQRTHPCKQVIVIGAHPGLASQKEREERLKQDEVWAKQLETTSFDKFLQTWYDNPLFTPLKTRQNAFITMLARRKTSDPHKWAALLRSWSVGHFSPFIPENATFLHGELDHKYAALYQILPPHIPVRSISGCGHAAHLEDPAACAAAIRTAVLSIA